MTMVFVEKWVKEKMGQSLTYEKIDIEKAKQNNRIIIKCCQCDRPAHYIDHFYPFLDGANLCKHHKYKTSYDQ